MRLAPCRQLLKILGNRHWGASVRKRTSAPLCGGLRSFSNRETAVMNSAEGLRAQARRLQEAIKNTSDLALKQQFAAQAFELAMRAEMIARSSEDPDFLRTNIARYRRMLSVDDTTIAEQRLIEAALSDAEELLQATKKHAAC